jgi:hypothetical protein
MSKKQISLEEDLRRIYEISDIEFNDPEGIRSFREFFTEKIGFGPIVKSGSLLILGRLKQLQSKIKVEKDIDKKINLLGIQNLYLGSLLSISISVDVKDKSILSKGRSIRK